MRSAAFCQIPPADRDAVLRQIGPLEETACKQLAEIGCDTGLLLLHLWFATSPTLLEGRTSFKAQHQQHRLEVERTRRLIRDIEHLRPRIRQAATFWGADEPLIPLDAALRNFVDRLKLNCELNKHTRADYLVFLGPAILSIQSSYARHSGTVQSVGDCEQIEWSGRVPPKIDRCRYQPGSAGGACRSRPPRGGTLARRFRPCSLSQHYRHESCHPFLRGRPAGTRKGLCCPGP